jgi:hypothetical protein
MPPPDPGFQKLTGIQNHFVRHRIVGIWAFSVGTCLAPLKERAHNIREKWISKPSLPVSNTGLTITCIRIELTLKRVTTTNS